jgi:hypothetical protein
METQRFCKKLNNHHRFLGLDNAYVTDGMVTGADPGGDVHSELRHASIIWGGGGGAAGVMAARNVVATEQRRNGGRPFQMPDRLHHMPAPPQACAHVLAGTGDGMIIDYANSIGVDALGRTRQRRKLLQSFRSDGLVSIGHSRSTARPGLRRGRLAG